eukprot:768538-Hanusia_phi.AAC.3
MFAWGQSVVELVDCEVIDFQVLAFHPKDSLTCQSRWEQTSRSTPLSHSRGVRSLAISSLPPSLLPSLLQRLLFAPFSPSLLTSSRCDVSHHRFGVYLHDHARVAMSNCTLTQNHKVFASVPESPHARSERFLYRSPRQRSSKLGAEKRLAAGEITEAGLLG